MSATTNAAWSAQQREWLQALGFDVLVLAGAASVAPVSPHATAVADEAPRSESERDSGAAARGNNSALLRAVLHAAGRRELGDLAAWLPDPAVLRGDPVAKRALWPRLRALRRPVRQS